jgi:hypothetical protein
MMSADVAGIARVKCFWLSRARCPLETQTVWWSHLIYDPFLNKEVVGVAKRENGQKGKTEAVCPLAPVSTIHGRRMAINGNAQPADMHPYKEAQGFQRLIDLLGYDVVTLVEKSGESASYR